MKPYFEYKGKTYEFEANFTIHKQFSKEQQKIIKENSIDFKELVDDTMLNQLMEERKKLVQENRNASQEELEKKAQEILFSSPKLVQALATMEKDDEATRELYEKYCRIMFEKKYPNELEIYDEFINELCCDKGINYVYSFFESVCRKVFMNVGKEVPQQKTSFSWEENKEVIN